MTIYNFNETAWAITWAKWLRMGGCGISNQTLGEVSQTCGAQSAWVNSGITLGDIARSSKVTDRNLAGFAARRLGLADFVVVEYA